MTTIASLLLVIVALPAIFSCGYLLALTLLSMPPSVPNAPSPALRFDIIVPAHDEAAIIERAIASLKRMKWPRDRFRILVIADNCSDATASVARSAGADVFIRHDASKLGKGYALQYGFDASRVGQWADAVVVVDADSDVSANLLEAFAARIQAGLHAVQSLYGVRNPTASWRTRLVTIAIASFMMLRSRAREWLKLSCGIRGNGWCVTHELLAQVPYQAFSIAEDVEYGIAIARAGHRVAYAEEAHAHSDMATTGAVARTQRLRWEDGRFQLLRTQALPLLAHAWRHRSLLCLDLCIDLMVMPLSYIVVNVLALVVLAVAGMQLQLNSVGFFWVGMGCFAMLVLYVCRGWQLSRVGVRAAWDLARAPWYVAWKLSVGLRRRQSKEWIRTTREERPPT